MTVTQPGALGCAHVWKGLYLSSEACTWEMPSLVPVDLVVFCCLRLMFLLIICLWLCSKSEKESGRT